jgi:hypothetical protein
VRDWVKTIENIEWKKVLSEGPQRGQWAKTKCCALPSSRSRFSFFGLKRFFLSTVFRRADNGSSLFCAEKHPSPLAAEAHTKKLNISATPSVAEKDYLVF